ncbi:hypothetical protein evm_014090 [Chilo suppressalis]|nr:hypothetical protein evm_014090 [Chilo suppressalis]
MASKRKIDESQSILTTAHYSQDEVDVMDLPSTICDSEYHAYLPECQSQLRSCDSTPDLYRSTGTQTLLKTTNKSTQCERIVSPIKETAQILADGYFAGDETLKKKFIECYINVVSSIIRVIDK